VSLDHFRLLRVVGKGAFGKVRIVERKDTGLTFALKYIRKDEGEMSPCRKPWPGLTDDQSYAARVCAT
jgi:serine/threonine protein kinase